MDNFLLILVAFLIPFSVLSFYGGFIRKDVGFSYMAQTACVGAVSLIIMGVFVLWKQGGAEERLAGMGIVPHPAIKNAVGVK